MYDTVKHTWSTAHLGTGLLQLGVSAGVATVGDLTFITGDAAYESVKVFNAATAQWSSVALWAGGGPQVLLAGRAVLIGQGPTLDVYDVDTGRWSVTRLHGMDGNTYAGVTVGPRAVYVTRPDTSQSTSYGQLPAPFGRPYLDVFTGA